MRPGAAVAPWRSNPRRALRHRRDVGADQGRGIREPTIRRTGIVRPIRLLHQAIEIVHGTRWRRQMAGRRRGAVFCGINHRRIGCVVVVVCQSGMPMPMPMPLAERVRDVRPVRVPGGLAALVTANLLDRAGAMARLPSWHVVRVDETHARHAHFFLLRLMARWAFRSAVVMRPPQRALCRQRHRLQAHADRQQANQPSQQRPDNRGCGSAGHWTYRLLHGHASSIRDVRFAALLAIEIRTCKAVGCRLRRAAAEFRLPVAVILTAF